ncbi:MAG: metalloregulator ArsR/SmtB family transcription factor [Rhizobiaceae bacterium]
MTPEELEPVSHLAVRLLSALANQKRLMIMSHLFQGELSVNALAQKVQLSQSALSQHLAKLRSVGIVSTRRDGQTIFYKSASDDAKTVLNSLCKVYAP